MKHLVTLLILGGALFFCPSYTRAESYTLTDAWTSRNQGSNGWGRSSKRPLIVDLSGHILTVPSQVLGYTLKMESEEGEVYTYYINGTTLEFPQELSGNYQITISDGNSMYHGTIEL